MFEGYELSSQNIYTFNIDVLEGDHTSTVEDERIGVTIMHIFQIFFTQLENVAVYICDNLDSRHLARKRKFDLWFMKYNDGSVIKEDGVALIEGTKIYNAVLVHQQNEELDLIIDAFRDLNKQVGNK